ncbi:o-succinylbenzoate synthase [Chamaesiphon minutus]|uniref:o-succinylbenzoate synthase n=1 Tax=Chamaesiphon minutus (strain ATCC 27169 / PCC 6605) TaxID=1173020 RepID=K9UQV2_CHAP6|nr:o-succinylbenzoate synthase [Chamaesiphon minutus]AFY96629.1 o-succinylbenzoic acid synthetase [Chamaesiphon minutus PCC 6605]
MKGYQFTYSVYRRPFRQPLTTSHGTWAIREGIIIQLTDANSRAELGEIAPIPWFGSESIDRAIEWCQQVGDNITKDKIHLIPDDLPACQFGFGSALTALELPPTSTLAPKFDLSGLLPTGAAAIAQLPVLVQRGYSTFKWKIGVLPIAQEEAIWRQLMMAVPIDAKLRLDANGGLTQTAAERWLEICSSEARIEFIEQPLAPEEIEIAIELAAKYHTPIALDESVATFDRIQAAYARGWRGIYVIKPGIAGFPWRLAKFVTQHQLDVVFSAVMETKVGTAAALRLASDLKVTRSLGFGVEDWFDDDM